MESLVVTSRQGTGKRRTFFYSDSTSVCQVNLASMTYKLKYNFYQVSGVRAALRGDCSCHQHTKIFRGSPSLQVINYNQSSTPLYVIRYGHRLNMELDLQSLFGLHVHRCTLAQRMWIQDHFMEYVVSFVDVQMCPLQLTCKLNDPQLFLCCVRVSVRKLARVKYPINI